MAVELEVLYCRYCASLALVIDTPLASLPTRPLDDCLVCPAENVRRIAAVTGDARAIRREGGVERQYRLRCSDCQLPVAFRGENDATAPLLLFPAAVTADPLEPERLARSMGGASAAPAPVAGPTPLPAAAPEPPVPTYRSVAQSGRRVRISVAIAGGGKGGKKKRGAQGQQPQRTRVQAVSNDAVTVAVAGPAQEDKRNAEVLRCLAAVLGVALGAVALDLDAMDAADLSVLVTGLSAAQVTQRLLRASSA